MSDRAARGGVWSRGPLSRAGVFPPPLSSLTHDARRSRARASGAPRGRAGLPLHVPRPMCPVAPRRRRSTPATRAPPSPRCPPSPSPSPLAWRHRALDVLRDVRVTPGRHSRESAARPRPTARHLQAISSFAFPASEPCSRPPSPSPSSPSSPFSSSRSASTASRAVPHAQLSRRPRDRSACSTPSAALGPAFLRHQGHHDATTARCHPRV